MNPELKQRLIGAAVVTALATIFIPMLFDDPVDNKGTAVSELPIPAAPIKSAEVSANKLPTPANKAIKKPNVATEEPSDTEDDPTEPPVIVDDADAEATEPPVNGSTPPKAGSEVVVSDVEQAVIEPEEDVPSESLDTGVVAPAVKKPTKPVEPDSEVNVKPSIKKTETNTPKLLPTAKPENTQIAVAVKPPAKKAETNTPAKPANTAIASTPEKAAKNPELVRWTIQAGSFSQKDNATALMKTLREQGMPVVMETIPSAKGSIYRLKIGPELDKKKAAANKAKLDKQGVGNILIAE